MLGDFEHPAALEDSRRGGGEEDGENQFMGVGGSGKQKMGVGGGREGEDVRRSREKESGSTSDLDFVIDVTQTEPKSMSLQVIKIFLTQYVSLFCCNFYKGRF